MVLWRKIEKNKWIYPILLVVFIILGTEIFARFSLGLGETVLYIEDAQYEYIYAPSQNVKRFGNEILTNEYSMRSLPLQKNEKRVLIFGDSVLNGGSLTDHNRLATTRLEKELQSQCVSSARVLNISAGGWGPDNAYAYLKKFGGFNATKIIIVFSSHDAHDNMNHEKIVGVNPDFPINQPYFALLDGFNRYLIPKIKMIFFRHSEKEFSKFDKIDIGEGLNVGWQGFVDYTKENNLELFVVLHPTKKEIESSEYNENGKQIIDFLNANYIPYLLELDKIKKEHYRDAIHYNEKGQEFLFQELLPVIQNQYCQDLLNK